MNDSIDPSMIGQNLPEASLMRYVCINEVLIFDQSYIISMCVNNSTHPQIDLQVEAKESGDQWKSSFDGTAIEKMTLKTGNFKSFDVFVTMLEKAINQESSSVSLDLFTSEDLDLLRRSRQGQPTNPSTHSSNKRYLILIYNAEYDRVCYPLSLRYCGKPDPLILIQQNRQLIAENQILKSRIQSDIERSDAIYLEQDSRFKKQENNDYYTQLSFNNPKEEQQLELLRHMIRTSEDALIREKNKLQKTKIKKDNRYKLLINQIQFLKTSERQLRCKVKNLTNNMNLLKQKTRHHPMAVRSSSKERAIQPKGCSSCNHQQRVPSSSSNHRRYRSSSVPKQSSSVADSRTRFNPTAYIQEKNLKLRQIESEKRRETRRRLSTGRHGSDSDISINSLKLNKTNVGHRRSSPSRKRLSIDDSFDSDIERSNLRTAASNNSTIFFSPRYPHQNLNSPTADIDERLKSLEKFMKQNLLRK